MTMETRRTRCHHDLLQETELPVPEDRQAGEGGGEQEGHPQDARHQVLQVGHPGGTLAGKPG